MCFLQMTGIPHSDFFFFLCCCHPQSEEPPHTIKEGKAGVHSWRAWAWIVSSAYSRWWVLHVCFSCWETSIAFRWRGSSPDFAISLPLSLFFLFYFMAFPGYSCLSAYELCQRSYSFVCVLQCKSLTWKALFSFFSTWTLFSFFVYYKKIPV